MVFGLFRRKPTVYCLEDQHDNVAAQQNIADYLIELKGKKGINVVFQENLAYGHQDPELSLRLEDLQRIGLVRPVPIGDGREWYQIVSMANTSSKGTVPVTKYLAWAGYDFKIIGVEDPVVQEQRASRQKAKLEDIYAALNQECGRLGLSIKDVMEGKAYSPEFADPRFQERMKALNEEAKNLMQNEILADIPLRNRGMAGNIRHEIERRGLQNSAYVCGMAHFYHSEFKHLYEPSIKIEIWKNPAIDHKIME